MKNRLHEDTKLFWKYRNICKRSKSWYSNFRMNLISRRYNAVIPIQADIKGIPILPHGLIGIFISKGAQIGYGCTIFQNVTIGSNTLEETKHPGSPVIGNNVFIGANSVIVGGIKIGHNVRIGAGVTVFQDIPDNATVVCAEPRVILHTEVRNNGFIALK